MSIAQYLLLAALGIAGAFSAQAQNASNPSVTVSDAWVRATVPGQKATGAFMKLNAKDGGKLLSVSSPAAAVVQLHEMKMNKDVMKMAELPQGLDLPPGQAVELKPGSYHVMLMDLKAPLTKDSSVPLILVLQDAKGVTSRLELNAPVRLQAPAGGQHDHAHGDHSH